MCAGVRSPYNGAMTTTAAPTVPHFTAAAAFLEALAEADFDRLATTLDPGCAMRALLPPGYFEFEGSEEIAGQLAGWFGPPTRIELVDATVGEVGSKVHLRWRLRAQRSAESSDREVVEQQAYVEAGELITRIDLLCSGFHPDVTSPSAAAE